MQKQSSRSQSKQSRWQSLFRININSQQPYTYNASRKEIYSFWSFLYLLNKPRRSHGKLKIFYVKLQRIHSYTIISNNDWNFYIVWRAECIVVVSMLHNLIFALKGFFSVKWWANFLDFHLYNFLTVLHHGFLQQHNLNS